MTGKGVAARLAATQLLHAVLFDKRLLSDLLADENSPLGRLQPADRARAQLLTLGVLRHVQGLDAVIDTFLDRTPPPKVRNTLRLAAFELLIEGNAAHGVVNAAVEIIRGSAKSGRYAGLVNAVSRKVASEGQELWSKQEPQKLPSWLAKPIQKNFGKDVLPAIEAAHQAGAPIDLTMKNPSEAKFWAEKLSASLLPTGSIRLHDRPQITALGGFASGEWWVQDAAAAVPARMLGEVHGEKILDICAAPGGKTMQLAAGGAKVTALDISADRIARLRENLTRTQLSARTVVGDALRWTGSEPFDAILLDAPCSATGTIRRHPDLPFAKAGTDMSALFQLQADLIDAAFLQLRSGGRLVFCTCSLLPREGEMQIKAALERHSGAEILPLDTGKLGMDPAWITEEGGLRLRPDYWPEIGGMDGFYMAMLRKP